jgi:hypothetical protein
MTRFEELTDIIYRNKNKNKTKDADTEIEVSGLSPSSGNPLVSHGTDESDPDLIDQLYRNKSKPNDWAGASTWD